MSRQRVGLWRVESYSLAEPGDGERLSATNASVKTGEGHDMGSLKETNWRQRPGKTWQSRVPSMHLGPLMLFTTRAYPHHKGAFA